MPSVLFVCTANQYRSPIAAAFFRKLLQDRHSEEGWLVDSAGTWTTPNRPLSLDVANMAILLGLNIERRLTQVVSERLLAIYDLILVMEKGHQEAIRVEFPRARERVYLLSEMANSVPFDIPDPYSYPGQSYRILRDMCDLIQDGFPKIKQLADELSGKRLS